MLPCSTGSREQHNRANGFKKLTIQQHRVPKGEKGGERKKKRKKDNNPRKGMHEGREKLDSRKKRERQTR